MNQDPRVSPWARRFVVDEETGEVIRSPRDVTPLDRDWIRNRKRDALTARDAHLRAFGKRAFYCVGSALAGIFIPPLAVIAWLVAVGWGIAAGISAFEALFSQVASTVGSDD